MHFFVVWKQLKFNSRCLVGEYKYALSQLMGCTTARLHHDHLLVKEPRTTQRTPFHQDQPCSPVRSPQTEH